MNDTLTSIYKIYLVMSAPPHFPDVRTLDDMTIVSPEAIYVFCKLNPFAIMDLYVHVVNAINALHRTHGISGA